MNNEKKEAAASVQELSDGENTKCRSVRVHRVGTVTAGLCMIVYGGLFLAQLFFDTLNYQLIFSLWPFILILLGLELLLSNFFKGQIKYDNAAIFLLFVMTIFAMGMAVADVCMETMESYFYMSHVKSKFI